MSRLIVHKAEPGTDLQRRRLVRLYGQGFQGVRGDRSTDEPAELSLQLTPPKVQRPLVSWRALDEHEVRVGELDRAGCQRFEAALVRIACGDQATILETEHASGGTPGQFEIARVVQLANELHDCGQAKAVERTFQLNHVFDFAEALVRNPKKPPRRASG